MTKIFLTMVLEWFIRGDYHTSSMVYPKTRTAMESMLYEVDHLFNKSLLKEIESRQLGQDSICITGFLLGER